MDLVKKTWNTPFVSVKNSCITKHFISHSEYHHTDGIGTKGIYHFQKRSFKYAVIDALAMNLNDMALQRAIPYALTNHLFLPEDDQKAIIEIINHLSKECKNKNIAITGGETAIHNNIEGLELSITMLGFLNKPPKINKFRIGDALIGIKSNGLHSNGFTKIRELYGNDLKPEFIAPTYIYSNLILDICSKFNIYGMTHITGGGFTKIKNFLRKNADAAILNNHKLNSHHIFYEIHRKMFIKKNAIETDKEMYKTFNCGIGFIFGIKKEDVIKCLNFIKEKSDFEADIIGKIIPGVGNVIIYSQFSNLTMVL